MIDMIRPALHQPLADLSLVLDDLTITPAGKRRVVRVVVDRDLSGIAVDDTTSRVPPLTLDEVAEASRAVSVALDEGDLMGTQPFTLEVSSPGVDRSLRGQRRFRRNVGRLVALVLESGDVLTARVISVSGGGVELEVPAVKKVPATRRVVALDDITSAKVQVEFGPGSGDEPEPPDVDDEGEKIVDASDDEEVPDGH